MPVPKVFVSDHVPATSPSFTGAAEKSAFGPNVFAPVKAIAEPSPNIIPFPVNV